jgi:hypothetical protein
MPREHDENVRLRTRLVRMAEALRPFAHFADFVLAARENDGGPPPGDNDRVAAYMAAGGSDYIWWKELMAARAELAEFENLKEKPDGT